jgi:hypothetical protein
MTGKLLKLRAGDAEDVQVVSAVLQDSIVPVCDMVFEPETKNFVLVAQRLRREAEGEAATERICCAVTVKSVTAVQMRGIDRQQASRMLDLLAIILEPAQRLTFVFAGDARIRLDVATCAVALEDFGEPWPALCRPCHEDAAK